VGISFWRALHLSAQQLSLWADAITPAAHYHPLVDDPGARSAAAIDIDPSRRSSSPTGHWTFSRFGDTAAVRWVEQHPLATDIVVAAVLTALHPAALAAWDTGGSTGYRPMDAFAYRLAVLTTGSVAVRRLFPFAVLVIIVVSVFVLAARDYPWGNTILPTSLVLYTVGANCTLRRVWAAAGLLVIGLVGVRLTGPPEFDTAVMGANLVFCLGVLYFGWTVQARRQQAAVLEERNHELEDARDQLARQAVTAERLRLARELHDVMAHSMGVIAVQSAAGRHVLRTDPAEAEHALRAIETTSRDALAETRHMLGVLRRDGERVDGTEAPLGLSDLPRLVSEVAQAGLPTDLVVDGERPVAIPSAVDLSAYRIVQEALTNAIKVRESGPGHCPGPLGREQGDCRGV
jgi:signal transduction histidine kinase